MLSSLPGACPRPNRDDSAIHRNKNGEHEPAVFCYRNSRASLLFLRADAADALDFHRRPSSFLGNLAVLLHDEPARGFIAIEPAKQFGRHAPVGALGAVFIDDIEKGEFAFGIGPGFFRHAGFCATGRGVSTHKRSVDAAMVPTCAKMRAFIQTKRRTQRPPFLFPTPSVLTISVVVHRGVVD